jgi:hypothetical protein
MSEACVCVCVCVFVCIYIKHPHAVPPQQTVLPLKMCRHLRRNLSADHAIRNLRHGLVELGGSGGLDLKRGGGERRGGEGERKYSSTHTDVRCAKSKTKKLVSIQQDLRMQQQSRAGRQAVWPCI